jgi:hypothetical protein
MIDKSTRQHYVMQGKVRNYLGKQKMVKVPKHWKSAPGHPETELAYITEPEKKLLLKADLHGSMKSGKPNTGPEGLLSFNWQGSGEFGGGKRGNDGGNGKERDAREEYIAKISSPVQTKSPQASQAREEEDKKQREKDIRDLIAKQQEEKYDVPVDPTKFGETVEDKIFKSHPEYKEQEAKRAIQQLSTPKGTQEALREFKALKTGREYRPDISLLDKLNVPHSFKAPETLTSGWKDKFGRGIFNLALSKTPLANLNPYIAGWNLLNKLTGWGKKIDPYSAFKSGLTSNITDLTKTTPTDTRDDRFRGDRGEGKQVITAPKKDVVTESIQKFSPRQMDLVRQRYDQLQQVIKTGMYNGQRLNNNQLVNLQNVSKQMQAFLVDPQKTMMMAKGGLAGLHG